MTPEPTVEKSDLCPWCIRSKASLILSSGNVCVTNSSTFRLPARYSFTSTGTLSRLFQPSIQNTSHSGDTGNCFNYWCLQAVCTRWHNMPPPPPCKLTISSHLFARWRCCSGITISSYLFARWHLFWHVGYLRHKYLLPVSKHRWRKCTEQMSSRTLATNKPTLNFSQAGCPSCRPTNSVKAPNGKWSHFMLFKFVFDHR